MENKKVRIWDVQAQNKHGEQRRILAGALTTAINQLDPQFADFSRIIIRSYPITSRRMAYLKAEGLCV